MAKKGHRRHYWTIEELKAAAAPYSKRVDFMREQNHAYISAYHKGILDEICSHMKPSNKKRKHLVSFVNFASVLSPAIQCSTLKEFRTNFASSYDAGLRFGIDYQEFFENKDNADYLKELIVKLAEDSVTGTLGKNRELAPHLR